MTAWLLWLACARPTPAVVPDELVLDDVTLHTEDGQQLSADHAALRADGGGRAEGVTAQVAPTMEVRADHSEWDLRAQTARFHGAVRINRGPVELDCDQLLVQYKSAQRIDHAVADGEIHLRHGARVATAAHAELDADTGQLVLTGAPQLREGANQLSGARIVLWLDDERVECDSCRLLVDPDAIAPASP